MKKTEATNSPKSSLNKQLGEIKTLLDSSVDVICSFDAKGNFVSVNAAAKTVWGYAPEELIGRNCFELIPEADHEKTSQAAKALVTGVEMTNFENTYQCKDGQVIPILWSARWDAQAQRIYGVAKDAREKIKIENELRDKQEQLEKTVNELKEKNRRLEQLNDFIFLADMIPQIIWTTDENGRVDYHNQKWYEYTGFTERETTRDGWVRVIHPDDLAVCIEKWSHSWSTGEDFELEYRLRSGHDGSYRWHLGRAVAMRDKTGKIIKWFGTGTDIHDNKLMREQLENNNAELSRFRTIAIEEVQKKSQFLNGVLRNLPVIVFRLDENGITTDSLGAGLELVKLTEGQAVGHNAFLEYPDMQQRIQHMRSEGLNEYESVNIVDGNEVIFQMYLFPDELHPNAVLGFGLDITEKKKAEKILTKAKQQAENANQFKTRFLASMSHEIRTPLNAILGFAGILKGADLSAEQSLEYLNYIESSGSLLLKLIGDVLDLSKIEEGKISIHEEEFVFKETIEKLISPYRFKANEKGLELDIIIADKIPYAVIGDSYRLNQIIINLVGNALKFTKEGNITVSFDAVYKAKTSPGSICLQLVVTDTGIGILPEKQSAIFESFMQADDSIVREFGGSGLGLSITSQLITLMGGSIKVQSPVRNGSQTSSRGTSFTVEIPLRVGTKSVNQSINVGSDNTSYVFDQQIQILVAEDNELNQRLASFMLNKMGCDADIARNGLEAIELIQSKSYDLILMDVQMPLMDGFTATRKIRNELNNHIPIIGLTASVFREDIEDCIKAGMSDHMGKPYDQVQLFSMIEKWFNKNSN